jgi:nitrate reductase gamma subunit
MNPLYSVFASLTAVVALVLLSLLGVLVGLEDLFGIWIPYAAVLIFVIGFIYRVVNWSTSPVPFRIPTTCGQQKTLPWIRSGYVENPHNALGVTIRMILEVMLFRSLFRNLRTETGQGQLSYASSKWLWTGAILFHLTFFTIIFRHLRLFLEPIPWPVAWVDRLDSLFDIFVPTLYLTDVAFLAALLYLLLRRVLIPQVRYVSLPSDYFPLFLILAIAASGVLMRHVYKVDLEQVKAVVAGLATFQPAPTEGIGFIFFVHLFLVCALIAYFPFSKLMHLAGVFLSPTRNLANNNRMKRHVNPWNYPVKVHTYEEYEDEFREIMKNVGIPVEKE